MLAWDLTPDDSRNVLWARTSKSRIDDLQQLVCVAIRVRDNQLELRLFLIFNVALLNLFKAPAKIIPVNMVDGVVSIKVIINLVGVVKITVLIRGNSEKNVVILRCVLFVLYFLVQMCIRIASQILIRCVDFFMR